MIAPLATNAHAVFVPPPSIPRIFSSSILYVAAVYDCRPKCKRKFIGGHRPPLQSSQSEVEGSRCASLHLPIVILRQAKDLTYSVRITQSTLASSRPYVTSLSPSRTGVVFAVRDDDRVRTEPLFHESSFV